MTSFRDALELFLRTIREFFQDQWFDRTRNVQTAGDVHVHDLAVGAFELRDAHDYQPARPAHIRHVLHRIPVAHPESYTYIDFGSGKGRTLFIAAERPFRQIIGVEFSEPLHRLACANIRSFRRWRPTWSTNIQSLHQDAVDFVFPEGPLVLYFFNPFGRETAACVLRNLAFSLNANPRHIVIILLWPRWADLVSRLEGVQPCAEGPYYQIFEIHPGRALPGRAPQLAPGAARKAL